MNILLYNLILIMLSCNTSRWRIVVGGKTGSSLSPQTAPKLITQTLTLSAASLMDLHFVWSLQTFCSLFMAYKNRKLTLWKLVLGREGGMEMEGSGRWSIFTKALRGCVFRDTLRCRFLVILHNPGKRSLTTRYLFLWINSKYLVLASAVGSTVIL